MNTYKLFKSLNRVAILLAIICLVGSAYLVSAQKDDTTPPFPFYMRMDFDGDLRADLVFADPTTNVWTIQNTEGGSYQATIGSPGDRAVVADYDGDHKEDVAVVQIKGGQLIWRIQRSSDGKESEVYWGLDSDILVQGDYDGDGLADPAVWRSSEGIWYVLSSKTGEAISQKWGDPSDIAMPGDYDGDGQMDVCVFRPSTGSFFYFTSSSDQMHEVVFGPFVMNGYERFVPADYDGDGKTDFATFDATTGGTFVILQSSSGKYIATSLHGSSPPCGQLASDPCVVSDFAIPADYDKDGIVDPAIWDSKNSTVTAMGSSAGVMEFPAHSSETMISVSSFFVVK